MTHRLFRLETEDLKYIDGASKKFFEAQQMGFDIKPYVEHTLEAWRVLGLKYGFDSMTVTKPHDKGVAFILAVEAT
jgi:hypothetical protein